MEEKKDQNQKLQIQASTKKESLTGSIVKDITDNIIVPKFLDTMLPTVIQIMVVIIDQPIALHQVRLQ